MTSDLLEGAVWTCARSRAGSIGEPARAKLDLLDWLPADVPGTAAQAVRASGASRSEVARQDYDAEDWWYRSRFAGRPGEWWLMLHGLANVADVWVNGAAVAHSANMFTRTIVRLDDLQEDNELLVRCAALRPLLAERRPRARWKTSLVENANLRFVRSSLLGRIPGWTRLPRAVGPWRPIALLEGGPLGIHESLVTSSCVADGGTVDVTLELDRRSDAPWRKQMPRLAVAGTESPFELIDEGDHSVLHASLTLDHVERWWPHTHGEQPLYDVTLLVGGENEPLGKVGFRTVEVDKKDGCFRFIVNGQLVFVRGANWFPPDTTSLAAPVDVVRNRLSLARAANMNMLRVPGTSVYADDAFLNGCDELGIMVWHDCMFAFMDYPDDDAFLESVTSELRQAFSTFAPHPSLVAVCGNQEVEEVAAMSGVTTAGSFESRLFDEVIPSLSESLLPGVEYVPSNPSGGEPVFRMDHGVSQYFGVGGYLRPLSAVRTDDVKFAAECLALSIPPEPEGVARFGGSYLAGHDADWKDSLHHDAGRSWDMEDVRSHYTREIFGVDPFVERYVDVDRSLDLARATAAVLAESVFTEWRRAGSASGGGLMLALTDLAPGAGWGLIDVDGVPKAPWYALRRAFAPICARFVDEGLNGLYLHLFNDGPDVVAGRASVEVFAQGEVRTGQAVQEVKVPPRASTVVDVQSLFEGFRDLNYAYHFGPPQQDVIVARFSPDGRDGEESEDFFLPVGHGRPREADLGLHAEWLPASTGADGDGDALVSIRTRRFAQWVSVSVPGFLPSDSWFHLAPGAERVVSLSPIHGAPPPPAHRSLRGRIRALNSLNDAVIRSSEGKS